MKVQELFLPRGEAADVDDIGRVDPHPLQRRRVSHRGHNERAVVLKPDEAAIKEMIDARRQEQSILTV